MGRSTFDRIEYDATGVGGVIMRSKTTVDKSTSGLRCPPELPDGLNGREGDVTGRGRKETVCVLK